MSRFIAENRIYELLERAGLAVPRFCVWGGVSDPQDRFQPGESVVLKALVQGLWHKSDLGLVRFEAFDPETLSQVEREMREASRGKGEWCGLLVAEHIHFANVPGLPAEALVSLRHHPEAGWLVLMGLGGIHAEAWAKMVPPLVWPVAFVQPATALEELKRHPLGRIWLGTLRQTRALTTEETLGAYLNRLWDLVRCLEREQVELLEMNPVVLDAQSAPMALDGVGLAGDAIFSPGSLSFQSSLGPGRDAGLLERLLAPRSMAVMGISSHEGSPGRVILQNLMHSHPGLERLVPIKPGESRILGLPCLSGVEDLKNAPVDLLVVALPASKTVKLIEQLCEQGGGAEVVYLVPGGLGDGADSQGRGARLERYLEERRAQELWTPRLVGPNGVGFLCAEGGLDALFIPESKLPVRLPGGPLALLSQSGAFLLTCLSNLKGLRLRYAASIGNQLDLRLSDFLHLLAQDAQVKVVACYVEGFRPGDLSEVARAARTLSLQSRPVLLYKGGRSVEGQAAASSHTGALAGDWEVQRALLERAGVKVARTFADFEAALTWLSIHPEPRRESRPEPVAILTNAGFEAVASADRAHDMQLFAVDPALEQRLRTCLADHGLQDLVAPRLPLDLTPMAGERAFLDCARLLLEAGARTLVMGLVPFTPYLETENTMAVNAFAAQIKAMALTFHARLGLVVDGGMSFDSYRNRLAEAELPVFKSMERALGGLGLI